MPWLLLITAVLVCTADDPLVLLESDAAVLHHLLHAWAPLDWEMGTPPCLWPGVTCAVVSRTHSLCTAPFPCFASPVLLSNCV